VKTQLCDSQRNRQQISVSGPKQQSGVTGHSPHRPRWSTHGFGRMPPRSGEKSVESERKVDEVE